MRCTGGPGTSNPGTLNYENYSLSFLVMMAYICALRTDCAGLDGCRPTQRRGEDSECKVDWMTVHALPVAGQFLGHLSPNV